MDIAIIVIAIACLSFLVLKGFQMPIAAILVAGVLMLGSAMDLKVGYLTHYATAFGNFFKNYFILMFLAAIFGKIMELGGVAASLSRTIVGRYGNKSALFSVFLISVILSYGAINAYVQVFALYPIAMTLFKKADIPRRMFMPLYIGAASFVPGSAFTVGIWNAIPTQYLGTKLSAAWQPSVVMNVVVFAWMLFYMYKRAEVYKKRKIGFSEWPGEVYDDDISKDCPNFFIALLPILSMLIIVNAFGIPPEAGLVIAIVIAIICYFKYLPRTLADINEHLKTTTSGCMVILASVASAVAFGGVVTNSPGYARILPSLTSMPINPLLAAFLIVTIMAGVAASAGGGLSIAMPIVANTFLPMGVNPVSLHRISSYACLGLDSLPHNGVINAVMSYAHTTPQDSYFDVFVVSVLTPITYTMLTILYFTVTNQVYL